MGVYCRNCACPGIHKNISMQHMVVNSLKLVLAWFTCIVFNEIYARYLNAQLNSLSRKWEYIAENYAYTGIDERLIKYYG